MVENNASRTISTVSTRPLLFMFGITLRCRSSGFEDARGCPAAAPPFWNRKMATRITFLVLFPQATAVAGRAKGPPGSPLGDAQPRRARRAPARQWLTEIG